MPIVAGYGSDSDSDASTNSTDKQVAVKTSNNVNITIPSHDSTNTSLTIGAKRTVSGYAVVQDFDDYSFKQNQKLYNKYNSVNSVDVKSTKEKKEQTRSIKRQRQSKGDISVIEGKGKYRGPWAGYSDSSDDSAVEDNHELATVQNANTIEENEEEEDNEDEDEVRKPQETTVFHGSSEFDYQGNSYMYVPRDLNINLLKEPGYQECFAPKKRLHEYEGHTNGTQHLQFLPNFGHLLLSCGNDNKIFLWDVYHKRELLRGYYGHTKPVKYVHFNNTGTEFVSCAYDNYVKIWDTETGKCKNKIKLRGTPNVVKYHPVNQNEILVGLTNKKIEHFDISSNANETIQTYDHHMGAINSIEFIDNNDKFVTSSDDKSLRIWKWRINMPIKQIADPYQYSMPCLKLHPHGKYFAAQSMDDKIVTFSAREKDKFKKNKKKTFAGHDVAGYSIDLGFSPDGKNLMSGDSHGNLMTWDWKTCRLVSTLRVDDSVLNCIDSSPQESSLVAIGSQKGKIYLYD